MVCMLLKMLAYRLIVDLRIDYESVFLCGSLFLKINKIYDRSWIVAYIVFS